MPYARALSKCLSPSVIGRRHFTQTSQIKNSLPVSARGLTTSATLNATKWYYAIRKGREPGIYEDWDTAKAQVTGFSGADYQKFASREAAEAAMKGEVLLGAVSSKEKLVVYTDGSHSGTGQGGFASYFAGDATPDLYGRVPSFGVTGKAVEPGSNNKSELYAVLRVLEEDPDPSREIHFHCDSSYVVEAFNGRDGAPPSRRGNIKNRDIILYIQELIDNREKTVQFFWVKGHAAIPGNVDADRLAALGTQLPDVPSRDLKAELETYRLRRRTQADAAAQKAKRKTSKKSKPA